MWLPICLPPLRATRDMRHCYKKPVRKDAKTGYAGCQKQVNSLALFCAKTPPQAKNATLWTDQIHSTASPSLDEPLQILG